MGNGGGGWKTCEWGGGWRNVYGVGEKDCGEKCNLFKFKIKVF